MLAGTCPVASAEGVRDAGGIVDYVRAQWGRCSAGSARDRPATRSSATAMPCAAASALFRHTRGKYSTVRHVKSRTLSPRLRAAAVMLGLVAGACAVNPVSQKREVVLVSVC